MPDRPRVVVALARPDTEQRRVARARYVTALERGGAAVISVAPGDEPPAVFDGLCLSGGEDVAPSRYGQADEACEVVDAQRDELELELLDRARQLGVPVLGICRGFQLLNVGLGGSLTQHVEGHRSSDINGVVSHTVQPLPGSKLAEATSALEHRVNSRHHQAVTAGDLADGLVATVMVGDLVEAFEMPGDVWTVGVQWHPERTAEVDPGAAAIFEAFVRATERVPAR